MIMTKDQLSNQEIRERLRAAGLRITAVRVGIIRLLAASPWALSAQDVSDQLKAWWDMQAKEGLRDADGVHGPKPDRVTVYRTLNSLVETGLAYRVDPGDRVFRFVLLPGDQAGKPRPQYPQLPAHFVCEKTGRVEPLGENDVQIKINPGKRKVTYYEVIVHGISEDADTGGGKKRKGR